MATITSAQSGDFSDTATWVGGVVPTVGDIAVAATGHIIAIDVDVTVTQVDQAGTGKFTLGNGRTLTANVLARAGTFTSGGTVEVTATSGNTATIIGDVTGVSTTAANVAGVVVTGTGTLQLTGNVTGSGGNVAGLVNGSAGVYTDTNCIISIYGNLEAGFQSKSALRIGAGGNPIITIVGNISTTLRGDSHCIVSQGLSVDIQITGTVIGGPGSSGSGPFLPSYGVYLIGQNNTCSIVGDCIGGTNNQLNAGVYAQGGNVAVNVTGKVTGGSGAGSPGIALIGTFTNATVTGDVEGGGNTSTVGITITGTNAITSVTGNITGGGGLGAYGINSTGTSSLVSAVGTATAAGAYNNAISSTATTNGVVFSGNMISSTQGALPVRANVFRLLDSNLSGFIQYADDTFPTGSLVTRVSADLVQGMPSASDVRFETLYGVDNTLTGTLHMPNTGSVGFGVLVDNTVGVLASTATDVADEIANRLLAVTEENNIVTVSYSTGSVNYARTKVLDSTRTVQLTEI
jgi:hypothetical protein